MHVFPAANNGPLLHLLVFTICFTTAILGMLLSIISPFKTSSTNSNSIISINPMPYYHNNAINPKVINNAKPPNIKNPPLNHTLIRRRRGRGRRRRRRRRNHPLHLHEENQVVHHGYRSYGEKAANCKEVKKHDYSATKIDNETSRNHSRPNRNAAATSYEDKSSGHYFLGAVIANRVFQGDKFRVGPYEVKQWIEYMIYAGVEHLYWYDTAHDDSESQERGLAGYIGSGVLTYHRFHGSLFDASVSIPKGYHFEQDQSYVHFLKNYANEARWVVELDVDEYPFSPRDPTSCFLQRLVWDYELQNRLHELLEKKAGIENRNASKLELPIITQILMNCMFFLGNPNPSPDEEAQAPSHGEAWVIEKYQRRKRDSEGTHRRKPIFRASLVASVQEWDPHYLRMARGGTTIVADEMRLRMNHYWGARATNFGPDTPELLSSLVPDTSVNAILSHLKAYTGLRSSSIASGWHNSIDSRV